MQADKKKLIRNLNIAKGQLNGISKMIEEDRYCIDVYTQINATRALLKSVNNDILEAHIQHCIREAFGSDDESKIAELMKVIKNIN